MYVYNRLLFFFKIDFLKISVPRFLVIQIESKLRFGGIRVFVGRWKNYSEDPLYERARG